MLRSEIPASVVGDAVRRLEEDLWYLHAEGGDSYYIHESSQPKQSHFGKRGGCWRRAACGRNSVSARENRGTELRVSLGPTTSNDLPDSRERKLAVLSTDHVKQNETSVRLADETVNRCGQPFRNYPNTILVLSADSGAAGGLRQQVKRMLALRAIQADKSLIGNLSSDNKHALESKLRDAEGGIGFRILTTYRHIARATGEKIEWLDLGLPTVGERSFPSKARRRIPRAQEILSLARLLRVRCSKRP